MVGEAEGRWNEKTAVNYHDAFKSSRVLPIVHGKVGVFVRLQRL